jgi:hypothetical protein
MLVSSAISVRQNVFAGKESMPATHDATLHGVVFDILVGSESRAALPLGLWLAES